jgi:hypothetical protein
MQKSSRKDCEVHRRGAGKMVNRNILLSTIIHMKIQSK